MEAVAANILEIIKDYRNDDGIYLSLKDIMDWGAQFGEDGSFILEELNHILSKVYLSKQDAKRYISLHLKKMMSDYGYTNIIVFLQDTEFLDMQAVHKSQTAILRLMDEVLTEDYQLSYKSILEFPKKNFVYFDDVLATGGTIGRDLVRWLGETKAGNTEENYKKVLKDEYRLSIHLFCLHTWGCNFQNYRIVQHFKEAKLEKKVRWYRNYEIENHLRFNNQALNIAIPTKDQPSNAKTFLANLTATKYEDYAYRPDDKPGSEGFFTSPENRIRYENLLLQKGLYIIGMIKGPVNPNIRPLGLVNPNYKTYGLGTHFFTWRNVPNNSPLVFWWNVTGHAWKPLFPVANRGGY